VAASSAQSAACSQPRRLARCLRFRRVSRHRSSRTRAIFRDRRSITWIPRQVSQSRANLRDFFHGAP
jgi:hypothetical protein